MITIPKLFEICGYHISIWSNENGEAIHVHVSKGRPTPNSPKIWITRDGKLKPTDSCSKIPPKDLRSIMDKLQLNVDSIISFWNAYHGYSKFIDD